MTATQTAGTGGVQGEDAAARPGPHVDTLDKPADYDPDVLGAYGLEFDGPRCAGEDCRVPVEDDGLMCEPCEDSPHEFRPDTDPRWCVCGRIRAALVHQDDDERPEQ